MKKILYVWKGEYPWDVRVEKICKSLIENNFEVYLLSRWGEGQKERELIDGIHVIRAGFHIKSTLTTPIPHNPIWKKSIELSVEEIKPDIIMPREIMLAEECGKVGKKHSIPVIMDMAENYPAAMKDWKKYNQSLLSRVLVHSLKIPDKVEKKSVNLMSGIITVCEEQNSRLISEFDFPAENLQVVHNTPSRKSFKYSERKFDKKNIVFGHHGHTTAEKSLEKFLMGFIEASRKNEEISLKIAGSGESIDDLRKIVENPKNNYPIEFTGKYNFNDLQQILNNYDIGVIPYQISDFNNYTIHNKIFDFFAIGIPVLVSKTLPFQRIIEETKAGILVNCEDINEISNGIEQILDLDLEALSKNARKAFDDKYNWETDSNKLIDFLKRFI